MKVALYVVAFSLLTMGTIWVLQGVNILPDSFMTGQIVWAKRGGMVDLCGIAYFAAAMWKSRRSSGDGISSTENRGK